MAPPTRVRATPTRSVHRESESQRLFVSVVAAPLHHHGTALALTVRWARDITVWNERLPRHMDATMKPNDLSFGAGPDIGETPPNFTLPDQFGAPVNYAATRGGGKAIILFYRSASW